MEELDDLKSIWREPDFKPKNEAEIASMLKGQSKNIISKLKRNVWFELVLTIAFSIGLAIYAFMLENGAMRWTTISLLVLFVVYVLYFIKKIILLNQFDASENLKVTLQHLYERLTVYITFYKRSYTILYPVYFCLGLLFGLLERGTDQFLSRFEDVGFSVWFIVFTVIFFIGIYTLTNWYLKKLYGDHLDKLRNLLNELI